MKFAKTEDMKPVRNRRRFDKVWLLVILFAALFLPSAVSAADQENSSDMALSAGRWTVSAEVIALNRIGGVNQTLVSLVPGNYTFTQSAYKSGTEAFNSNQFQFGFSAGPKICLTYQLDPRFGVECEYFNIANQSASVTVGPNGNWLVMKSPGGFWQTQDFPYQGLTWGNTTNLYNAEINGRMNISDRLTLFAGFRWLQLNDNLQGTMTPADQHDPVWKNNLDVLDPNVSQIPLGENPPDNYPPFWNTNTTNNLYGLQIGVDGKILKLGNFSLDGVLKTGIFDNYATQSTGVSIKKTVYPSEATTNQFAFVCEVGLTIKYQVGYGVELKAGYEVLWLDGIALAPGQIQKTYAAPNDVHALGINSGSNVLFQGATCGLGYSFSL
ncbi:MAG: hypothetical protein WCV63_05805 [Negativicutes bacterium]|jgi:hypothetical protein